MTTKKLSIIHSGEEENREKQSKSWVSQNLLSIPSLTSPKGNTQHVVEDSGVRSNCALQAPICM